VAFGYWSLVAIAASVFVVVAPAWLC